MFYPFSFNVKYSLWKCWLEVVLIWGKDYNLSVWLRPILIRIEIMRRNIACPCSLTKVAATLIVSSAVAKRLEPNSVRLRRQTPLEERLLQTTFLTMHRVPSLRTTAGPVCLGLGWAGFFSFLLRFLTMWPGWWVSAFSCFVSSPSHERKLWSLGLWVPLSR